MTKPFYEPATKPEVLACKVSLSVEEEVERKAEKYKVSYYQMLKTLEGESGLRHKNVYGDSGLAYGIAQFHRDTFRRFRLNSKMEYTDRNDQIEVMAYMFSMGKQCHWTEWRKRFDPYNSYCGRRGYRPLKVGI